MERDIAIRLEDITKVFGETVANSHVSMDVYRGEILSLLGENGSGKTTLMNMISGIYFPDGGTIYVNGQEVMIRSPKDAFDLGIGMIHQHFKLVDVLTAAENVALGLKEPGRYDIKKVAAKVKAIGDKYGFHIDPNKKIYEMSVSEKQTVEIIKVLYRGADILILDEPTAVLTPQESEHLMQFIKDFTSKGSSVVFITHKMKEVMEVADRIVVMRNGVVVDEVRRADTDEQQLARLMIGQEIVPPARDQKDCTGDPVLTLRDVSLQEKHAAPLLSGISFTIRQGEIFGIAGVSGNGQDDLCDVICGLKKPTAGQILLSGQDITGASIRRRNACGIGYVPVDRYRDGMVMDMTLSENILLKRCFDKGWFNHGFIRREKLDSYTNRLIENHRVKANDCHDTAGSLSGGNQQKVVLGREVDLASRLLILNQPTRGLDMGAVDRIHHVILEEKANQKAVLLISTELSEIFELCDRIAVMHGGKFMGIYRNGQLTTQQIGLLMAGVPLEEEVQTA